jgi:DNA-binding transcriptional ArsR family regulator
MTQMSNRRRPARRPSLPSAAFFRALSDPNRLALFARLLTCGRACTVSELNACCPVDLSVVSRHLAILRDAGVLTARKRGKEVHYEVNRDCVAEMLRSTADAVESCCGPHSPCASQPEKGRTR